MRIISIFQELFGNGTDKENQQPSSSPNDGRRQANMPHLGINIEKEDDAVFTGIQEDSPSKEVPQPSPQEQSPSATVDETPGVATYNLIILDESGSMSPVRAQTISGCNETLNSIRNTAKENKDVKQYVSIFCFDTAYSRYIFHDVPVEETRDLTVEDYNPNACTPLYDAIGYTVSNLARLLDKSESVGVVTIITDGYENASRLWNHHMVVKLIEVLKRRGWVFTFIGANIDVKRTANSLGIDSHMKFEQTEEGMAEMFEADRRSRRAYSSKMDFMRKSKFYREASEERRRHDLGALNSGYFVEEKRVAPDFIDRLGNDEVFVFGSNVHGQHHGGASLYALEHFGAINGQAEGIQGRSYAIPTKGNTFEELKQAVERFNEYVVQRPHVRFMLSAIGCGSAGYGVEQVAPLFRQAYSFGNVYVPKTFLPYVDNGNLTF